MEFTCTYMLIVNIVKNEEINAGIQLKHYKMHVPFFSLSEWWSSVRRPYIPTHPLIWSQPRNKGGDVDFLSYSTLFV